DPREERGDGRAVVRGVEQRAARTGATAAGGHRPVEDVGDAGEDHADHTEHEVTVGNRDRSGDGDDQTDDREPVGADADPMETLTDRFEPSLDRGTPTSVEHRPKGTTATLPRPRSGGA